MKKSNDLPKRTEQLQSSTAHGAVTLQEAPVHIIDDSCFESEKEKLVVHMGDEMDIFNVIIQGLEESLPRIEEYSEKRKRENILYAIRLQWERVKRSVEIYSNVTC